MKFRKDFVKPKTMIPSQLVKFESLAKNDTLKVKPDVHRRRKTNLYKLSDSEKKQINMRLPNSPKITALL